MTEIPKPKYKGFRVQLLTELDDAWSNKQPEGMPPVVERRKKKSGGLFSLGKQAAPENPLQTAVLKRIRTVRAFAEDIVGMNRINSLDFCFADASLGLHGHGRVQAVEQILLQIELAIGKLADEAEKKFRIALMSDEFIDDNKKAIEYGSRSVLECLYLARSDIFDQGVTSKVIKASYETTRENMQKFGITEQIFVIKDLPRGRK